MYLITTHKGVTKRLEIPEDIARAGDAEKYAAKPPADAWEKAEVVGPNWPFPEPPGVATAPVAPAPITPTES